MDATEPRMGERNCYAIIMIDEHCNHALALVVPSLNCDIARYFFSRAGRLFPVDISQLITDNGKEFLEKYLWSFSLL